MMQRQIKGRACTAFFLVTASAIVFNVDYAWAAGSRVIGCNIGSELAGKIYKRIAAAKKEKNEYVVFENRIFFWEVFKYSGHCKNVSKMAAELTKNGLGADNRILSFDNPIPPVSFGGVDFHSQCVRNDRGLIFCREEFRQPSSSGAVASDFDRGVTANFREKPSPDDGREVLKRNDHEILPAPQPAKDDGN